MSSRIINTARSSPITVTTGSSAAFEDPGDTAGFPLTIAATHVDGLVLALTPFSHSLNYRSAVLFGRAKLVDCPDERLYAMRLLTDGVVPGRFEATRSNPTAGESQSTGIMRVQILAGSAKIRSGGPKEEARDLADPDLAASVWTGVVPVHQTLGEPVAAGRCGVAGVPAYLADHVRGANADARVLAELAAKEEV